MQKFFTVLFLLLVISASAQKLENDTLENWKVSGVLSPDFFPFSFNEVKNYNTNWDLNFTYGILLSGRLSKLWSLGVGMTASTKNHTQTLNCDTCTIFYYTPVRVVSQVRYIEIPVIVDKIIIGSPGTSNVSLLGGLTTSLINKGYTEAYLGVDNDTVSVAVNDFYFSRYLLGFNAGVGINLFFTDEISLGIHPHIKLYMNDLFNDNFLNMSSTGFLFRFSYHFE